MIFVVIYMWYRAQSVNVGSQMKMLNTFYYNVRPYQRERSLMIDIIQNSMEATLEHILFGNPHMSHSINCKMFLAVQNYIKETKRFWWIWNRGWSWILSHTYGCYIILLLKAVIYSMQLYAKALNIVFYDFWVIVLSHHIHDNKILFKSRLVF